MKIAAALLAVVYLVLAVLYAAQGRLVYAAINAVIAAIWCYSAYRMPTRKKEHR